MGTYAWAQFEFAFPPGMVATFAGRWPDADPLHMLFGEGGDTTAEPSAAPGVVAGPQSRWWVLSGSCYGKVWHECADDPVYRDLAELGVVGQIDWVDDLDPDDRWRIEVRDGQVLHHQGAVQVTYQPPTVIHPAPMVRCTDGTPARCACPGDCGCKPWNQWPNVCGCVQPHPTGLPSLDSAG